MWPFKRREKALSGTPPVVDALGRGWAPLPLLGGGARQRIQDAYQAAKTANYAWMYANSPAVRTVVDCIARNVGQLDLRLYEEVDEAERRARPEHPAALSLRYPSETVTSDQFVRQLFKDFLTSDDAVAIMTPAANGRLSFKWVPISWVSFLSGNAFDTDIYRIWNPNSGNYFDFTPDQVLHWRGENPTDPLLGLSHLETLRDVVAEDAALQQATVELANSGLTDQVYGFRPLEAPVIQGETLTRLEEDLANKIKRSSRRPFILQEGTELKSVGVSPRDAQMYEIRKWAISRVASEYGVPGPMVGLDGDYEKAQALFYSDTLPPYCEEFTKMLNLRICVRAYGDTSLCFEFNLDEKHMGNDRLTALVSATGRPVMVTNEARAKLNLPPVENGDELVTPLNVIVGENPKPSPQVMPPQDPNSPSQDGSYREEPKQLDIRYLGIGAAKTKAEERLPQLHPGWKTELDRQHRNVDLAKGAVQRHFNRLQRSLQEKAKTGIEVKATDWERLDREFATDLAKMLRRIVDHEGGIYSMKLGGYDFDMRFVENYLRAMAAGAAEAINHTVRQEIADAGLDEAMNRGPQHVESAGTSLGVKATLWAREEAAKQGPEPENRVKTWIPNTARHAEFGGQTVPLGADWPAGFAPGSAPGCACSMAIS